MNIRTPHWQITNIIFFIVYWLRAISYAKSGDVSITILYVGLGIMTTLILIETMKGD